MNTKKLLILVLFLLAIITYSGIVSSQTFDMAITVCDTNWQCTNYTQDSCGDRLCLDANFCGVERHRPVEHIDCPDNEANETIIYVSSGGGGGGGSSYSSTGSYDENSFVLSKDIIRVDMLQYEIKNRYVTISSQIDSDYKLSIIDESGLGVGQSVLTLNTNNFYLGANKAKKITLLFDTNETLPGTYVFLINVSNNQTEDKIMIILDVGSDSRLLDFVIEMPFSNKIVDDNSIVEFDVILPEWFDEKGNVEYYLIKENGEKELLDKEKIYSSNNTITKLLRIPNNLEEGIYAIGVTLQTATDVKTKSELFWVQYGKSFASIEETPANIEKDYGWTNDFYYALIFIFVMVLLMMSFTLARGPFPKTKLIKTSSAPKENNEIVYLNKDDKKRELLDAYKEGIITQKQLNKFLKKYKKKNNPKESAKPKEKIVYVEKKPSKRFKEHKLFLPPGVMKARVSDDKAIVLRGGTVIRSLDDLMIYCEKITETVFEFHSKGGQNDFAVWTEKIFLQPALANKLKNAKNVNELKKAFYK